MDKKYFISTLIVFVVWMVGSFVVHGLLLQAGYAKLPHLFRTDEESQQLFHLMLLAHIFLAGAFTWIYIQGVRYGSWFVQGIRYGIAIVFLAVIPNYMIYYVVQPMPGMHVVQQIIFDGALVIILGLLVGFLYRKHNPTISSQ